MTSIAEAGHGMRRAIDWKQGFFVAAGSPSFVLFSMGAISATIGTPAWLVWTLSVLFGFVQSLIYAEIAGLHPTKSGGTAVHGATAWVRYSRFLAPLSLWSNWVAWTPVLAIGSGLGAGYLLSIFYAPDAAINTWKITLVDLGFIKEGLSLRINATFIIGAAIMLTVFTIQHRGILGTARIQTILTVATLLPLFLVCIVPLLTGDVVFANFSPFTPLAKDATGHLIPGAWDKGGWLLFLGGLFIAAWSTYAFETAVCYMSEYKNPGEDMWRAIIYSGLFCIAAYILIPIMFQGVLGTERMLDPGIYEGTDMGRAMASMVKGSEFITKILIILLFFTLVLSIMTAMAGSSRTLHQGGRDGWLPKYLGQVNAHGAPDNAMWTDLAVNMVLLLMYDYCSFSPYRTATTSSSTSSA